MKNKITGTAVDGTDRTQASGPVTALRVVGRDIELRLSPEERSWSLGSSADSVDLHVSSRAAAAGSSEELVSRLHANITRRGNQLWIQDARSANGIIFANGHKETEGVVGAGGTFVVGGWRGVKLIALDEALVVLRKELQWVMGRSAHGAIDAAIETIARHTSLVLVGERGCDQRELAKQIHFTSPRRQGRLVVADLAGTEADALAAIREADGGTLYVDLMTDKPGLLPRAIHAAIAEDRQRWIVAAPPVDPNKPSEFAKRFGSAVAHPPEIRIPPLRERPDDIPALLNTLFARQGSQVAIERIGTDKLAKLKAHDWPDNIDGLRHDRKRLHALAEADGVVKRAAEALGITRQSLTESLARLGL